MYLPELKEENFMFKSKQEFKAFRVEVEEALKPLAEKYGAGVVAGNINYGPYDLGIKVEFKKLSTATNNVEQAEFETYCKMYGFKPEDYGKIYKGAKGKEYKLVGFNLAAPKYPFRIVDMSTGKVSRCTREFLEQYSRLKKAE